MYKIKEKVNELIVPAQTQYQLNELDDTTDEDDPNTSDLREPLSERM